MVQLEGLELSGCWWARAIEGRDRLQRRCRQAELPNQRLERRCLVRRVVRTNARLPARDLLHFGVKDHPADAGGLAGDGARDGVVPGVDRTRPRVDEAHALLAHAKAVAMD